MDRNLLEEVEKTGKTATSKLRLMKQSLDIDELAYNLKELSGSMVMFMEKSVARYHDSVWDGQREMVMTHADCIRMLLPSLMESMMSLLRYQDSHHARNARDVFFTAMETSINGIISSYKRLGPTESSNNGEFLTKMDKVFTIIDSSDDGLDLEELDELATWLIKHSLTVAKASNKDDEEEITRVCQKILSEVNILKAEGRTQLSGLGNYFELLEQNVNGSLLRLVISSMPAAGLPLDTLLTSVLRSVTDIADRLSDDLTDQIKDLDSQTDKMFQLCHLCVYCTSDAEKAQKIRSIGRMLEMLETDLVPAILQLYFSPTDPGAKAFVKTIRQMWKSLTEELASVILSIVDPTAFSVILLQEMTSIAKAFRNDLYSQDSEHVQLLTNRLLAMAEAGVDLAWKDLGDKSSQPQIQPLAEGHPLVSAERSIWEVRAASKMVVGNIEDLSLHQSLQKRIQVLVSAFEGVVHLLTDKQEEEEENGMSQILGSLMENASVHVKTKTFQTTCISFRATKNLDKTAALSSHLRKDIYKLTVDLTPFTPRPESGPIRPSLKRKPSKVTVNGCILETPIKKSERGSRIVRRSSARLSTVINELSALSHELSVCLESESSDEKTQEEPENILDNKEADKTPRNGSLRRVALKNLTNKVVLTSANNLLQF